MEAVTCGTATNNEFVVLTFAGNNMVAKPTEISESLLTSDGSGTTKKPEGFQQASKLSKGNS